MRKLRQERLGLLPSSAASAREAGFEPRRSGFQAGMHLPCKMVYSLGRTHSPSNEEGNECHGGIACVLSRSWYVRCPDRAGSLASLQSPRLAFISFQTQVSWQLDGRGSW
jgi:hypothetical protein